MTEVVYLLFNRWFTSGILNKSSISESRKVPCDDLCAESETFTDWFPNVSPLLSIMTGFGKCCNCHESHLFCDLPKVLTDKSQVCAVELMLLEYFVSSITTLRDCLVQVIFLRKPILCSKIVDSFCVYSRHWAVSLTVWLTKRLQFLEVSNAVYFIPKSCYFCEKTLPSTASSRSLASSWDF